MKNIQLSRPLVLERPGETPDGAGGFAGYWEALGVVWADVRSGTGREVAGVGGGRSRNVLRIIVRGAPQESQSRPKAGQRFRDGGRIFNITAVAEADPRGKFLTCFADEEILA